MKIALIAGTLFVARAATVSTENVDVFGIVKSGKSSGSHSIVSGDSNVLDHQCLVSYISASQQRMQTDKTLVYSYSSTTNIFSSKLTKSDPGFESTVTCDVLVTCLGESTFDLQIRNLVDGKTRQVPLHEKFAKVFLFTRSASGATSIQYDDTESPGIANFKKSVVESLRLQKLVSHGIFKAQAISSMGVHNVSCAAVFDKTKGMYVIEERFTDNDIVEFSPATTARSSDINVESIRKVIFDHVHGSIFQSVEKIQVKFTNEACKDLGSEQMKAVTSASLLLKKTIARIPGVIEGSARVGLVSDTMMAKESSSILERRSIPAYAKSADLTNDHLVRHLLPRANELEPSQVAELVKEAEDMNDAERAGILFMILAASGQEAAHLHLIEIASSPSQKLSDSAKASLIFSSGVSERTARLAATKLASVDHLPIISSLLATQSPELIGELTKPYMAQLKSTRNPAQLIQAINGLSNLKDNLVSVAEDILPYVTYSESDTVRASAIKTVGPVNCRSAAVQSAFASTITNGSDQLAKTTLTELTRSLESCPPAVRSPILDKAVFARASLSHDAEFIQCAKSYLQKSSISPPLQRRHLARRDVVANGTFDVWLREGEIYDMIESLEERQRDVAMYPIHMSYLWGLDLGTPDMNARVLSGSFAGTNNIGCNATQIKALAHIKSSVRAFALYKELIDMKALAASDDRGLNGLIEVTVLGKSIFTKNIDVLCTETAQELVSFPVTIGRSTWHYPIKGFILSLDVGVTSVLKGSVAYSVCFKDSVSASVALVGGVKVMFGGKALASLDWNADVVLGGVALEGSISYSIGPKASLGLESCAASCISLRYGNDKSNFNITAQLLGKSWLIKDFPIPASENITPCLTKSSVSMNGRDPVAAVEATVPEYDDYPYYLWDF